jgi:hypothetical protein
MIECPADLSGCSSIKFDGRSLFFACSHDEGSTPFVVVLGFFCGQKEDIVTKDLIEPVPDSGKVGAAEAVAANVPSQYSGAHIYFI